MVPPSIIANIQQALNSTNEADQQDLTARLFPMLLATRSFGGGDPGSNVEAVSLREELLRQVAKFWSQTDPARALGMGVKFE